MDIPAGAAFLLPLYSTQPAYLTVKLTTIDIIGGIQCHVCQLIIRNKKEFDSHYAIHNTGNANVVYKCVVCYREFPTYPKFRNHCYMHIIKDKFKCETCLKMFSKLSALQTHIATIHKFSCSACKKEFPSKKELRIHEIMHKNDDSPPYTCQSCTEQIDDIDNCEQHIEEHCSFTYTCPICNEDISSPSAAAEHLSKHFDTKPVPIHDIGFPDIPEDSSLDLVGGIFCKHCDNVYKNRAEFDTHFIEQHNGKNIVYSCNICGKDYEKYLLFGDHCYFHISKGRFECDACDKSFPRLSLLVLHTEAFHSEDSGTNGPFPCSHCETVFRSENRLRTHIRDKHESKPIVCSEPHCRSTFETPKDLIYHQRVHKTGPRCRQCGLHFTSAAACEKHIHIHRKKLYSCPVCNRSYAEKYLIMKHIPQHFSSVLHLCKVCGKVFNAKSRLAEHIKSHSRQRDHVCSYCGKGFVKSYHLEQHLNIHTGSKPYKCSMCPKSFASYPNFSKHMRRMHNTSNLASIDNKIGGEVVKSDNAATTNETIDNKIGGEVIQSENAATTNETTNATNETMTENNNVVTSNDNIDLKGSGDSLFSLEESGAGDMETDSGGGVPLQQHTDLFESTELSQYMPPLPATNLTFVSGNGNSALTESSLGLPREYGPDLVNVIDLDDHILPHIDPLLTINQPAVYHDFQHETPETNYDAPWKPIIAKVYHEYPFGYGEIADGRISVINTDIY